MEAYKMPKLMTKSAANFSFLLIMAFHTIFHGIKASATSIAVKYARRIETLAIRWVTYPPSLSLSLSALSHNHLASSQP